MDGNRRSLRRARSWRWEPSGADETVATEESQQRWHEARAKAIAWAVAAAADPRVVYLDTETTGFGPRAEIVDIAVISADGQLLFESLMRPTRRIPADAIAIHGITNADVKDAPEWDAVYEDLLRVLEGRRIVVYNVKFDRQMVTQACGQYAVPSPAADWDCAMRRYADFYGNWDATKRWYRYQKLERAVLAFGADPGGHRAAADAVACRAVVLGMATTAPPELVQGVTETALVPERHVPAEIPTAIAMGALGTGQRGELSRNREESDAQFRWARAVRDFFALADGIPAELRERPGACGEWSVREVVAHCAGWEWEAARRLRLFAADPSLPDAVYNVDGFNGASVAVRARQDWSKTLDELAKASTTLATASSASPEDARTREWLVGRAADFEEHTEGLRRWVEEAASSAGARGARAVR